jgi:small subunit ribosomal protein S27e
MRQTKISKSGRKLKPYSSCIHNHQKLIQLEPLIHSKTWYVHHTPLLCAAPHQSYLQTLAVDLLNPSLEYEKSQHKLKRLVQSPNSYFMDVKCPGASPCSNAIRQILKYLTPGCFVITTVFSHAQTVVLCASCSSILCQPTGGRARLTEGAHRFSHA